MAWRRSRMGSVALAAAATWPFLAFAAWCDVRPPAPPGAGWVAALGLASCAWIPTRLRYPGMAPLMVLTASALLLGAVRLYEHYSYAHERDHCMTECGFTGLALLLFASFALVVSAAGAAAARHFRLRRATAAQRPL
ncbi:MAG: hypothetical protein ACYDBQ_08910 [Thermoplasmatota archaeon]